MTNDIRVLIVDDHPVVRIGIGGMLENQPDFQIVGDAENGEIALALIKERQPDVVLMDLRMPVMDGIETTRRVRAEHPQVQVLILTTYDSDTDIVTAIDAGAVGYILKDSPRDILYDAIRAASKGDSVLAPRVASRLLAHVRKPVQEQTQLSEREIEVLRLVSEGNTNKHIGKVLHISVATVKTHLIHIFQKLDVPDRASAVREAIERGLLS